MIEDRVETTPLDRPVELLCLTGQSSPTARLSNELSGKTGLAANLTVVDRLECARVLLEAQPFDVAILDVDHFAPGPGVMDAIRRAAPAVPVLVVGGDPGGPMGRELFRLGAVDWLGADGEFAPRVANAVRFILWRREMAEELALRARQVEIADARARLVLDASLDALIVIGGDGCARYVNPAAEAMFARGAGELVGHALGIPLVDGPSVELDIVRADGSSGVAELRVVEIDWEGERAHLAMLHDLTDHKRMEHALYQSEKLRALGTLAGGITHDFNNILLAVAGYAQLTLESLPAGHPAYSHVLEILKAGARAADLTRNILGFSRRQDSDCRPLHLRPLVEEAHSLLRPTLPARIEFRTDLPPDLPPILADASQVQQVLMNLTVNAVDAIGERSGIVSIHARCVRPEAAADWPVELAAGPYVRLTFEDNGPGMEQEVLSQAFVPFFTTKAPGRGTGMGLAIVHGIMKSHQGEITVHSDPGRGTSFQLYFPVATALPAAPQREVPAERGRQQHILVVDDDEALMTLLELTLRKLGYRATGFTDPIEALGRLGQDPGGFRALITDLSHARHDRTRTGARGDATHPGLPVILTTGCIRPQDEEAARQIGVREFILKPDTIFDLGRALSRHLDKPDGTWAAQAAR